MHHHHIASAIHLAGRDQGRDNRAGARVPQPQRQVQAGRGEAAGGGEAAAPGPEAARARQWD